MDGFPGMQSTKDRMPAGTAVNSKQHSSGPITWRSSRLAHGTDREALSDRK